MTVYPDIDCNFTGTQIHLLTNVRVVDNKGDHYFYTVEALRNTIGKDKDRVVKETFEEFSKEVYNIIVNKSGMDLMKDYKRDQNVWADTDMPHTSEFNRLRYLKDKDYSLI